MKIEGRKDKPYSERLYGELYILALLIEAEGNLPTYLFHNRLNKSQRTYRRYFEELHVAGLIPQYSSRQNNVANNSSEKDWTYSISFDPEHDIPAQTGEYMFHREALEYYLDAYSRQNPKPEDRLYRLGRILICSIEDCYYDDQFDFLYTRKDIDEYIKSLNMSEYVIDNGEYYHIRFQGYEDLYRNLSPRSRQRDLKLLQIVMLDVLKQHERF